MSAYLPWISKDRRKKYFNDYWQDLTHDTSWAQMAKQAHPDAQLHPEATGLASKTVEAHQAEEPLKLYSGWFCPFVQRAWTGACDLRGDD